LRKVTRRGLLGAGAAAVVGGAAYGRYAVGDEFEEHLASTIGVTTAEAAALTENAREGLGDTRYDLAASAFLAATTFPGRHVMPRGLREQAVRGFLAECIPDSSANLFYLGLRGGETASSSCAGLLRE
jgi:hypothetical protein